MPHHPDLRVTRRTLLGGAAAVGAGLLLPRGVGAADPGGAAVLPHARSGLAGAASTDVVVVGAGLAGLSAARALVAAGIGVVLAEARDRVGGRTLNHDLGDGRVIEVGGQWIGPLPGETATASVGPPVQQPQDALHKLAVTELGMRTFKTYNAGRYVDYNSSQGAAALSTYDSSTRIPQDRGAADAGLALGVLNMMAAQIDTAAPYSSTVTIGPKTWTALQLDAMSFETWMRLNLPPVYPADEDPGGAEYSLVNLAIESVFSAEPRDLSLLHVLFYIASAGTLDNLVNTANGAQDSRFVRGSQDISIRMAAALGDRVVLSAPVRRIVHSPSLVVVSGDTFTVTAKAVIVAIPPTLAGRIVYDPPLASIDGGRRDQLTQRVPMGTVIKVQAIYPHPFWRSQGLAGQATSDTGPVKITFDNTPFTTDQATTDSTGVGPGVLIGFIEGADGREYMRPKYDAEDPGHPGKSRREVAVLQSYALYFGPDAMNNSGYVEMLWPREQYTGGCYGGFLAPGVWTSYGDALRAPINRVFWAGTETATRWNGYMDGAVRSGADAAAAVMAAIGSHPTHQPTQAQTDSGGLVTRSSPGSSSAGAPVGPAGAAAAAGGAITAALGRRLRGER